jgi:hypothetical protein
MLGNSGQLSEVQLGTEIFLTIIGIRAPKFIYSRKDNIVVLEILTEPFESEITLNNI